MVDSLDSFEPIGFRSEYGTFYFRDAVEAAITNHVSDNGTGDTAAAVDAVLALMNGASKDLDAALALGRELARYARFHAMHAEVSPLDRSIIGALCDHFDGGR